MGIERVTGGAGRYRALPACVAVRVTWPVAPACVSTFPASDAGPESSAIRTGSPLEAEAERMSGGVRVVTVPGERNVIVWGIRAEKLAVIDLLEFISKVRLGAEPETSPVQPVNDDPGPGVATATATALGG
jgi:hypothetical protein